MEEKQMCKIIIHQDAMDKTPVHSISLNGEKVYIKTETETEIPYKMYQKCIVGSFLEKNTTFLGLVN